MGKIKRTVLISINYGENLKNQREKSRYKWLSLMPLNLNLST